MKIHTRAGYLPFMQLGRVEFDVHGGCGYGTPSGGGPYVLEVVDGHLPAGIEVLDVDEAVLAGRARSWGRHRLRIRITDVSCTPWKVAERDVVLTVGD